MPCAYEFSLLFSLKSNLFGSFLGKSDFRKEKCNMLQKSFMD